jgi:hypothetical protein
MGTIFGKQIVAEPAFEVLYRQTQQAYEIRRYATRFAASTSTDANSDSAPFNALARYIGVFGTPENQGRTAISMTAPVVKEESSGSSQPEAMAMTAPVVKTPSDPNGEAGMVMKFILPAAYDSMEKIPQPTNPRVHIEEIPPAVGAVHRYSGSFDDTVSRNKARWLAQQLREDGVDITEDYAVEHYQFWGYNPPFTLPMFRRNEVWIELDATQVDQIVNGKGGAASSTSAVN